MTLLTERRVEASFVNDTQLEADYVRHAGDGDAEVVPDELGRGRHWIAVHI